MPVGIDDISFYTTNFSLDLQELAANNGSNAAKYTVGIGQERMSVPGADEDVVTMAANACLPLLEGMEQRAKTQTLLALFCLQQKRVSTNPRLLVCICTRC